jgi:hypothetical protein
MLKYEITETQRRAILESLDWAVWALGVAIMEADDEDASDEVVDDLFYEKSETGRLWDALNALEPISTEPDLLDPDVMAERVKQIREIVEQ